MSGDAGSGPIGVVGVNPALAGNTAMIFDSDCPPGGVPADCSGGDDDLGTPNEAFGGPGVGAGGTLSNDTALGNLLIVSEDLISGNPDDADLDGASLNFNFVNLGTVTIESITIVDVELGQGESAEVLLFDEFDNPIGLPIPLPSVGDNGVAVAPIGAVGVRRMEVALNGSGGIDNIVFLRDDPAIENVKEISVDGGLTFADANDPGTAPEATAPSGALYRLIVRNVGNVDLENILVNDTDLGIVNVPVPSLPAPLFAGDPAAEVILTSGDIVALSVAERCGNAGTFINIADVEGTSADTGNQVTDSDPATLICEVQEQCTVDVSKQCLVLDEPGDGDKDKDSDKDGDKDSDKDGDKDSDKDGDKDSDKDGDKDKDTDTGGTPADACTIKSAGGANVEFTYKVSNRH